MIGKLTIIDGFVKDDGSLVLIAAVSSTAQAVRAKFGIPGDVVEFFEVREKGDELAEVPITLDEVRLVLSGEKLDRPKPEPEPEEPGATR